MVLLILLIPLFPLLGFLLNGVWGKKFSKTVAGIIGTSSILLSFLFTLTAFLGIGSITENHLLIPIFDWIHVGALDIPISIYWDPLSAIMTMIITGVGFLIHGYSTAYMKEDEGFSRFFAYLNLFVFFMLILVLGSGYVSMFIGWEGVGLCSYLLIGFWFHNHEYNNAAKKAFIMNRIGDLGFLMGIYLLFQVFGSLEFIEINKTLIASGISLPQNTLTLIGIFLFIGAMGKSAQIPLFTWLPDAMAGPTPVSALIHAATMVTAGIYMVVRTNLLYSLIPNVGDFMAIVGTITLLLGAIVAITQNDIKKILAYSTVSQLGYMFLGLGVGAYSSSLFHVLTHAFFKALLFLGAGSIIHSMGGEQDIRKMGAIRKKMPITFISMFLGTLAISGIPPFSGFFSKDAILSYTFQQHKILWLCGVIGAGLTAFYMFRLLFLTFFGDFRGTNEQEKHMHESPLAITIPLVVLAFFATIGGVFGIPEFMVGKANLLDQFLAPVMNNGTMFTQGEELSVGVEWMLTLFTIVVVAGSLIYAWISFGKGQVSKVEAYSNPFFKISYHKFYVDELYNLLIVRPLGWVSHYFYKIIDRRGIDGIVNGIGKDFFLVSDKLRKLQSGNVGSYVLLMVVSIIFLLALNMLGFKL